MTSWTTPASALRTRGRRVRRAVLARRRVLAALLAGVAALAGLRAVAAPPPETTDVLVAVRDLPAGEPLAAGDVATVPWPAGTAPAGLVEHPAGRVLAAPLRAGEPVTDVRLVGPGLAQAAPGLVAVPIRVPDAGVAGLLRAGDRVDLLATDPAGGRTGQVAGHVLVLAVPGVGADDRTGAAGGVGSVPPGRLVVVAVPPTMVTDLVGASVRQLITVVFSR